MIKEWTEEEISLLINLWTQGKSGSEIGKILGRTKGSVIGKIHRMNYTRKSIEVSKINCKLRISQFPKRMKKKKPKKKKERFHFNEHSKFERKRRVKKEEKEEK